MANLVRMMCDDGHESVLTMPNEYETVDLENFCVLITLGAEAGGGCQQRNSDDDGSCGMDVHAEYERDEEVTRKTTVGRAGDY